MATKSKYDKQGFEYLAIKDWEKYQSLEKDTKKSQTADENEKWEMPWIKDWTNRDFDRGVHELTGLQRYILQGCWRIRGRLGRNLLNDPGWVASALNLRPDERGAVGAVLGVLTRLGFLVLCNQEQNLQEKRRSEEIKQNKKQRSIPGPNSSGRDSGDFVTDAAAIFDHNLKNSLKGEIHQATEEWDIDGEPPYSVEEEGRTTATPTSTPASTSTPKPTSTPTATPIPPAAARVSDAARRAKLSPVPPLESTESFPVVPPPAPPADPRNWNQDVAGYGAEQIRRYVCFHLDDADGDEWLRANINTRSLSRPDFIRNLMNNQPRPKRKQGAEASGLTYQGEKYRDEAIATLMESCIKI